MLKNISKSIISKPKYYFEDPTDTMDDNVANELIDL
jgi:hypothetical protein